MRMRLPPAALALTIAATAGCGDGASSSAPDAGTDAGSDVRDVAEEPMVDRPIDPPEPDARIEMPRPANAAEMGKPCDGTKGVTSNPDCSTGYHCIFQNTTPAKGFCTIPCESAADPICATGYTGPGRSECLTTIVGMGDDGFSYTWCWVRCGAEVMLTDTCPGSLACRDSNMNGMLDFCFY